MSELKRQYSIAKPDRPAPWIVRYWKGLDKPLILTALLCSALSTVLLYSIWQNEVLLGVDQSYYITQLLATGLGVVSMIVLSLIDYHKIIRLWFLYAPAALILTLLTFTSLGIKREGADDQAWLDLGFIIFQPSELLKLAFLCTFALHLAVDEEKMNHPLHMLLLCLHGAVPTGLIILQGDYGTAIIFAAMFMVMLFCAKINPLYILGAIAAIPLLLVIAWNYILGASHKARILVLIHPGTDPENLEWQQDRGLEALANGQKFGIGLHAGQGAYVTVPELHNDFMFAHVGQVFGFVGAIVVVALLTFLCLKVLYDSNLAKDRLGLLLCAGVFAILFTHCVMNIGMVLKVLPVIGIPLPFISAGGTATVGMYVALGFVISVYNHNEKKHQVFYAQP